MCKNPLKTCLSSAPRQEQQSRSLSGRSHTKKAWRVSASPVMRNTASVSCLPWAPRMSTQLKFTKMVILARHFKLSRPNSPSVQLKMPRKVCHQSLSTAALTDSTFVASIQMLSLRRVPFTFLRGSMLPQWVLKMTSEQFTLTICIPQHQTSKSSWLIVPKVKKLRLNLVLQGMLS